MDSNTHWYAVFVTSIFALLVVRRVGRFLLPCLPHLRHRMQRAAHPLFFARSRSWASVTYIEAAALLLYIAVNGGLVFADKREPSNLMIRSGLMSAVNLIPLFVGGRTSVLADRLGIPLHTYYLAHYSIGGVVITQALLHVGLALAIRKPTLDRTTISGAMIAFSLIVLPLSYFLRRSTFLHSLLACSAIGGTLWHLIHGEFTTILLPSISVSLWVVTSLIRLVRILRNRGSAVQTFPPGQSAFRFDVRVPRQVSFDPGAYLYLYFDLQWRYRLQSLPLMVAWYEHKEEDGATVTDLTFFIQQRGGLARRLARELYMSARPLTVWCEGPYGQDLHLERYETVMLAARGIGIAGVLPYARHLLQRRFHDGNIKELLKRAETPNKRDLRNLLHRDATRKVDLFWELDQNDQEDLVSDQLRVLQEIDHKRSVNLIYCYYPERKAKDPKIRIDEGWKCIYPGDPELSLHEAIEQEAGKSRRNIVITCGDAKFTLGIQNKVLEITSKDNIIEFTRLEYGPGKSDQNSARLRPPQTVHHNVMHMPHTRLDKNIELAQFTRGQNVFEQTT